MKFKQHLREITEGAVFLRFPFPLLRPHLRRKMTTTSTAAPISNTYKASNPFAPFLSSTASNHDVNLFAPNDISRDLEEEEEEEEARSEGEGYDTQLAQVCK